MWKRVVLAAAVAGLVAGLALTAIQQLQVAPLIRTAEVLEASGLAGATGHGHEAPAMDAQRRLAATAIANIVLATGFALILVAALTLRGRGGWREGLAWGLAGYVVFFLSPALALPPELPGMEGAPLQERTLRWLLTVALTAGGLGLAAFSARPVLRVAGLLLVALPHVAGAPQIAPHTATATHDLAREFAGAAAWANAVLWIMIGVVAGMLYGGGKSTMAHRSNGSHP
jgi:cobalt transporter subunit CbtA